MRNYGNRLFALLAVAAATAAVLMGLARAADRADAPAFSAGEECSWVIRAALPADLSAADPFQITDTLDHHLALRGGVMVSVTGQGAGMYRTVLEDGIDYLLSIGTAQDTAGNAADTVTVTLTAIGMEQAAAVQANGSAELQVYIAAILRSAADADA